MSEVLRPWLVDFPERGSILLALDAILDEPRIVYVSPTEYSGELLEVAGRSALLADPRIPSVEDAGTWNDFDYVVVERTGGTSLARVLAEGPLDAEVAVAVVGELATVLTHAASRGMHHGILGPESVAVTAEGDVVVRGIAIDAAIAQEPLDLGLDQLTEQELKRVDARALVAVLYACLTGKWPGDDERAGLAASGRKNNRILPVSHFVDNVPPKIEEFVSGVMGEQDPGPRSPSEVVRFLEPWDTNLITTIDQSSRTEDELFSARAHDTQTVVAPETEGETKSDHSPGASPAQLSAALDRIGWTRPGMHGASAGVADGNTGRYADRIRMRQASTFPIAADKLPEVEEWEEERPQAPENISTFDANETARIMDRDDSSATAEADDYGDEDYGDDQYDDEDESLETSDGANSNDWFMGGVFLTEEERFARQQEEFERERQLSQQARERAERANAANAKNAETEEQPPTEALPVVPEPDEESSAPEEESPKSRRGDAPAAATTSGVTATSRGTGDAKPAEPQPKKESDESPKSESESEPASKRGKRRYAVLFGSVAVIAALALVGAVLVNSLGSDSNNVTTETEASPTKAPSLSTDKPTSKKKSGPRPKIKTVTPLDPEGDGEERNDLAEKVIPGEKGSWQTDRYNTENFGELKSGVGLALELKKKTTINSVGVKSDYSGGSFDVLVGTDEDIDNATKVGSGEFREGETETVDLKKPTKASYVFIWITELPEAEEGYRAVIPNIRLS